MNAHIVFNGNSRLLKLFVADGDATSLRHQFECHDVGVADGDGQTDPYGHNCKCPPGNYELGDPVPSSNPPVGDDCAYGFWFTPLIDVNGIEAAHGRAGIGIHGGGSDLANPYAPRQGWEWTLGCLRLQNEDNATFVDTVQFIHKGGGKITVSVVWP